jgi:hypothetical protein
MPLLIGTSGFRPDFHSSAHPNLFRHQASPAPMREPATRPPCACIDEMPPRSGPFRQAVRNSQHFPKNDPIASSHPPKASERLHGRESSVEMASGWNIYLDQFSRSPGRAFADVALDNLLFVQFQALVALGPSMWAGAPPRLYFGSPPWNFFARAE